MVSPLAQQPGIGPLTIGGYLREVVRCHGPSEAVVMRSGDVLTGNEKIKTSDLRELAAGRLAR
jgi:NDP-sugar pyrophosphorylase family protein